MRGKYKIWCKDFNEWKKDIEDMGILPTGELFDFRRGLRVDLYSHIVVWFTGRKDKNGKGIWEDSLLRDQQGNVGRVFYHDRSCSYLINWHRKDGSWETDSCFGYGVVIGNYWENPELLGK